jgi:uncharacterized protein DUF6247
VSVTAQPVDPYGDDPRDPEWILSALPERFKEPFLREYRSAVDGAREVGGYRTLSELLRLWSLRAVAYGQADFFERAGQAANAQRNPDLFTPIERVVPDWAERTRR